MPGRIVVRTRFQHGVARHRLERRRRMKVNNRRLLWALVACLGSWHALVFAQSPDNKQNLLACKNGWEACDRSKLTQSELAEVAVTDHVRTVSDCRSGLESCDHSKLTGPEATALVGAERQRNFSDCRDGRETCDNSKLTGLEAGALAIAEHTQQLHGMS